MERSFSEVLSVLYCFEDMSGIEVSGGEGKYFLTVFGMGYGGIKCLFILVGGC